MTRPIYSLAVGNFYLLVMSIVMLPPLPHKKFFFLVAVIIFTLHTALSKAKFSKILNPLALLLLFIVFFFKGLFSDIDTHLASQFTLTITFLFMLYIAQAFDIDINKLILQIGTLFVFSVLYLTICNIGFFSSVSLPFSETFLNFYLNNELGFIGLRVFGNLQVPMLHFVSSPLLLVILAQFIINNGSRISIKLSIICAIILSSSYLTGSRAIFLMCSTTAIVLLILHSNKITKIFISFGAILVVTSVRHFIDLSGVFSVSEASNSIKLQHIESFVRHIDGVNLIFGEGLAAYYYTDGFDKFAPMTEIMGLDLIRYFGLPATILFFILLIFPLYHHHSQLKVINPFKTEALPYAVTFLFYLLMGMANPALLNSFGMLVVIWYWMNLYRIQLSKVSYLS